MEAATQAQDGLYCSTAGTYFESREDLTEHQRSDFHRLAGWAGSCPPGRQGGSA